MNYLNVKFSSFIVYIMLVKVVRCAGILYPSPCPNIFQYDYDGYNELIGIIDIPYPNNNVVLLNIELIVANRIQGGYNGHIELAYDKDRTIDDILNKRSILYNLRFPYWERIPPRITKISVNSDTICVGNSFDRRSVPLLTVVTLQHTLTLRLPNQPYGGYTRNIQPTTSVNGYNINRINFKPQPPKDPSRIYTPKRVNSNALAKRFPTIYPTRGNGNFNNDDDDYNDYYDVNPTQQVPYRRDPNLNGDISFTTTIRYETTPRSIWYNNIPYGNVCGRLGGTSLVANGDDVLPGTYPWLVAIYAKTVKGLEFICGGSLISDQHIVSAAHCFKTEEKTLYAKDILVTLGRHNIMDWEQADSLISGASSITIHPDYVYTSNNMTADADISVITLKTTLRSFNKLIKPVCLWIGESDLSNIIGASGLVVGWGRDERGSLQTEEPKQVLLPIVAQDTCRDSHATFKEITSDRTFCAGNRNGIGPCNGDSGGGYMVKRNGLWTLRGVVSMSILDQETRCDLNNYFVFTDVAKFIDWLLPFLS